MAEQTQHAIPMVVDDPVTDVAGQPRLVPEAVTASKIERDLAAWRANAGVYRQRGWILLGQNDVTIDVGFLARVAVGRSGMPIMTVAIRLDYTNYDLWPPSVTFIDPYTGEPARPLVQALDEADGLVNDVLIDQHPATGMPFLCLPGIREYHMHPQHTGDDWLLHRTTGAGNLHVICDRVWRRMARNVLGLQVQSQSLPGMPPQTQFGLAQGDPELIATQLANAQAAAARATASPTDLG
jgi:hypothetical protein